MRSKNLIKRQEISLYKCNNIDTEYAKGQLPRPSAAKITKNGSEPDNLHRLRSVFKFIVIRLDSQ